MVFGRQAEAIITIFSGWIMFPPFRCRCGGSEVVANLKDQGGLDDGISVVFRKLKIEER